MCNKANNIFKSFINSFDDDNAFLYIGKNENEPTNIYYYGKEYDNKFIEESNVEWYKIDYKIIENMFINRLYSRLMRFISELVDNVNLTSNRSSQDNLCDAMENVNAFSKSYDKNKFYEIIYEKSGKQNSKK